MSSADDQLRDIADPQPLLPGVEIPLWFWIALSVVILALVASLVLFLTRRGTTDQPPPSLSFYDEARRALESLREDLAGQPLASVATDASLVLRHYLASCLDEPALYETHEEFIARDDALDRLPAGARERLSPLLNQLAECKYGPSRQNDTHATELVDSCLKVLQGLESTRSRQIA